MLCNRPTFRPVFFQDPRDEEEVEQLLRRALEGREVGGVSGSRGGGCLRICLVFFHRLSFFLLNKQTGNMFIFALFFFFWGLKQIAGLVFWSTLAFWFLFQGGCFKAPKGPFEALCLA